MKRREFLSRSSLAVAAGCIPGAFSSLVAGEDRSRVLRGGAGVFTERGGTIGWYVGEQGALVIDTQFPDTALHCLEGLRARTARKLDAVLITHHHQDHTAGIGALKSHSARIVAHSKVPVLQRAQAEKRGELDNQAYPDTVFDTDWSLDLGGETVRAHHFGAGHTGGDAVYHLEKANVAHLGDLVFNRMVPYIDHPGGASIGGWIRTLGEVEKTYPADTLFIYGHASGESDVVGGREALERMRGYLTGLLDYVRKGKAAGKSAAELAKVERIPGFPDFIPGWDGAVKLNVEAAWEELSI